MFSKRILGDIKKFNESKFVNIHIFPDESKGIIKAMIIGDKDTPYKYGFYFFTISFIKSINLLSLTSLIQIEASRKSFWFNNPW